VLSVTSTGTELRRFRRGLLPRLAISAMVLIPLLYGALYLWAFWDPTGNLDRLPVALVDDDTGATLDGAPLHAGDDVVDRLLDDGSLDWHVTDADDARRGVQDGTYYFSVTLPADFSAALASASGDDPRSAQLDVTYNDANSFLATTLGRSAMQQVQAAVSATAGSQAVDRLLVGLGDAHDGFARADDGAVSLADAAGTLTDGARSLADGAATLAGGSSSAASGATSLATGARSLADGTAQVADGAASAAASSSTLASGAAQLSAGVTQAKAGADDVASGARQVDAGVDQVAGSVQALSGRLATLSSVAAYLQGKAFDAQGHVVDPAAAQQLATLAAALPSASDQQTMATDLAALTAGADDLATGATALDHGLTTLDSSSGTLSSGAAQLSSGLATLASGAGEAATGASTLATGAGTLADGTAAVASGAGDLQAGATRLADGSAQLADGTATLASALADGAAAVPADDEATTATRSDVLATPVTLETSDLAQAEGFGEGFAPFFICLALFVGSLITWLLMRPLPSRALATPASGWRATFAGFLPALLVGLGQVVVMLGVIHLGVGLDIDNTLGTVAFTVLVAATFLALQQMLMALFGPAAGKVAVLALLMVQLASSGGTYPVATTPAFFQAIHPWLPMSYAVSGLRELITGGADGRLLTSTLVLVGVLVGSLAVTAWRAGRMRTWSLSRLHPVIAL
jgi:putative membrane protein